jgi:carbon monoxide dehydrogenase subunit G
VVRDCGAVQQGGQQQVQDDVYLPYAEASALVAPTDAKVSTIPSSNGFDDVSALQQCIPGRETIERLSDQEMKASVQLKIGPMMVCFTGIVTLSELDPPGGCTITGKGSGAIDGFAKGSAAIRLVFDGQPTPAKWKTFLLTWIGVYPTLLLIMYALDALVPNLWRPIQLAISSLLLVSSLTWLIMPRLTSLLRPWLFRGVKRADNRSP